VTIAILALGSQSRQGVTRLRAGRKIRKSHHMLPGVPKGVREWTLTLPSELPCWKLESQWTPKSSKRNYKGQNPSPWQFLYIIGKLLKCRCLKWARITHLDIWNTSYGQKRGRESNYQFDSRSLKVRNRSIYLFASNVRHTVGNLSTRTTTLL
jgi:hypothetical protein